MAEGDITQNQANYQLDKLEEQVTDQLDNAGLGGLRGGGRYGGPKGFPGGGVF